MRTDRPTEELEAILWSVNRFADSGLAVVALFWSLASGSALVRHPVPTEKFRRLPPVPGINQISRSCDTLTKTMPWGIWATRQPQHFAGHNRKR